MNLTIHPLHALSGSTFAAWLRAARSVAVHRPVLVSGASRGVHELARSSTITIWQPRGAVVECLEGCVWITLDEDIRDVIIDAGERFCPDRNSRALVHALETSRVRVARIAREGPGIP